METKEVIFLTGVIVGALLLLGMLYSYIKDKKLGSGGVWFIAAGIILFGLSIWHKFTFSPTDGISFETYDELKTNYESTVKEVSEIKEQKDNISKRLNYFETELKSKKSDGNNDALLKTLDSIKVSTKKIDSNILKINSNNEIMNMKFDVIDKKVLEDKIKK